VANKRAQTTLNCILFVFWCCRSTEDCLNEESR
jgi:hypothetical protein